MAAKPKPLKITWLDQPEKHDYPAAASYLSLAFENETVQRIVKKLKKAPVIEFKSKDIFRASGLALLPATNFHVEKDRSLIREGRALSPILLVRHPETARVIVADGFHRMCAVYSFDEDMAIPCKIV